MTRILPADPGAVAQAAALLREGKLVAFPTETVYGLGANALDVAAVQRIFDAKGRPAYNPVIVHVPDAAAARTLAAEWPPAAEHLAAAFWPGPITLVVPKRRIVPDLVTAGLGAIALRVPSHPTALALLRAAGVPIAAPSANRSGEVSPTSAAHVAKSLGDRVDLILDAGPTDVGIESAVIDLSRGEPVLLRPGAIGLDELERAAGPFRTAPPSAQREDAPRLSPGLLERHYAPRAVLRSAGSTDEARAILRSTPAGTRTGALLYSLPDLPADHLIRLPADPIGYGRSLYAALHAFDDLGCAVVVVETVPDSRPWAGPRDRLSRAAVPYGSGPTG